MTPVEDVMAAEPEERLEIAMYYLKELTCAEVAHLAHYRFKFGLTRAEAEVAHFLAHNGGRVCSYEQIWAITPSLKEASMKVRVSEVKRKLKGHAEIIPAPGVGYMMTEEGARAVLSTDSSVKYVSYHARPLRQGRPWTKRDVRDLRRMNDSCSALSEIAYNLDRSEVAVMRKLTLLGERFHAAH